MKKSIWAKSLLGGALIAGLTMGAQAQDWDKVEIKAQQLRDGMYALYGAGGNIGVSVGEDGVILIDDQYAPLTDKIRAALAEISDAPVRYVVNTHFHGDHSGGNENLGDAAVIVAHDNVRQRLSEGAFVAAFDMKMDPQPKVALPSITFNAEMSLHMNGDDVRIIHVKNAHTDGDSMIHFRKANVLHMGDLMFNGMFPFIDVPNGGSVDGILAALDKAIEVADDDTIVIPGHGQVTDKAGLVSYRKTIGELRDIVADLKALGKSLEEVKAINPFKDYDLIQFHDSWASEVAGFMYESL
ncbi:MBL fold metallo-hydrolase [Kordiimonas lacus]|uniref:Glyoxylase, beta-lactamase superfamily II n=1 Tax=Kordiimonas lacus TaxID=637679 RepID=A0A1G6TS64_9PROT|nr:MBL fold metallo-hydrolase [Kordiimonas lacus]SDD31910.1 Glyoxylase, beta-lactamase superfamily II [Kordiimonas lacus]